ncbi:hypothetical protein GCM10010278_76880 [Streptomyces melanogenes]|nr:hypothetical protein GCM10010278_76880 [Streptomyces melanogenes]
MSPTGTARTGPRPQPGPVREDSHDLYDLHDLMGRPVIMKTHASEGGSPSLTEEPDPGRRDTGVYGSISAHAVSKGRPRFGGTGPSVCTTRVA